MGPGVRIELLGPVRLWRDGVVIRLGAARVQTLLAVLALRAEQVCTAEELLDAVWAERPPSSGVKVIPPYVYRLRRMLPDGLLERTEAGYRLRVPASVVDVGLFEESVRTAAGHRAAGRVETATAAYRAALELFRGDPLAGLAGQFAVAQRARLIERRTEVLADVVELSLQHGPPDGRPGLVAELTGLVAEHPFDERFAGQLIRALAAAGRQADALDVYARTRTVLVSELGVEPGPALAAIHQELLRTETSNGAGNGASNGAGTGISNGGSTEPAPVGRRDELPYAGTGFVGRADELKRVLEALRPQEAAVPPVVTVDGMAGVGKTAFAVAAAQRAAEWYPDGRLYLNLHGHTPRRTALDTKAAVDRLLTSVGVAADRVPAGVDEATALWRSTVARRRVLIVVDNVADAGTVQPLLPGSPSCAVIVTGRHQLVDVDASLNLHLDPLPPADAIALLDQAMDGGERAPGQGRAGQQGRGSAGDRADLVRHCGNLPLAIRLAAARLRHRPGWSIAQFNDRLQDAGRRLAELSVGERGIRTAFRLSHDQLGAGAQAAFAAFGRLPGEDFDTYVAAAALGIEPKAADLVAEELLDANLVFQVRPGRYRLHDLLRAYAVELADRAPDPDADARVLEYYLQAVHHPYGLIADMQHLDLTGRDPVDLPPLDTVERSIAWADDEAPNLLPVVRWAADRGRPEYCWQIAVGASRYLKQRGMSGQQAELIEVALTAARATGRPVAEAHVLHLLGRSVRARQGTAASMERLDQALLLAPVETEPLLRAQILTSVGQALANVDPTGRAINSLREALKLAGDDPQIRFRALAFLGLILTNSGADHAAIDRLTSAVEAQRLLPPTPLLADVHCVAAGVHVRAGRGQQAHTAATTALNLAVNLRNQSSMPYALRRLADAYQTLGDVDRAVALHRQGLQAAIRSQIYFMVNGHRLGLGTALLRAGQVDEAEQQYERVRISATAGDALLDLMSSHQGLADCAARRDRTGEERDHLTQALRYAEQANAPLRAAPLRARLRQLDPD